MMKYVALLKNEPPLVPQNIHEKPEKCIMEKRFGKMHIYAKQKEHVRCTPDLQHTGQSTNPPGNRPTAQGLVATAISVHSFWKSPASGYTKVPVAASHS